MKLSKLSFVLILTGSVLLLSAESLIANGSGNQNQSHNLTPPVPPAERKQQTKSNREAKNADEPQEKPSSIPIIIEGPVTVINKPSPDDEAKKSQEQSKGFWEKFKSEVIGSPKEVISLGTLIVAGLAAAFTFGAYRSARRQAEAAEQTLSHATRPHLFVDGVRVEEFAPERQPIFFVKIVNTGSVTARNVAINIRVETDSNYVGVKYTGGDNLITIPANGSREYFITVASALNEGHIVGYNEKGWMLHVTGYIEYDGQRQNYCYKYNPSPTPRPSGVPQFIPCDFDIRRTTLIRVGDTI